MREAWRCDGQTGAEALGGLASGAGERLEISPFLGAFQLAEAIDRGGAQLAIHGHAHHGAERGVTPRGVPVRNVAMPLLRRPYGLYCLDTGGERAVVAEAHVPTEAEA